MYKYFGRTKILVLDTKLRAANYMIEQWEHEEGKDIL